MRVLPLLALSGAATAQQPGVMEKMSAWTSNFGTQIFNAFPYGLDAGASAVAAQVVQPLNMQNWKAHLWPKSPPEEWMVFMTGGNKTCFGRCGHAEATWNVCLCLFLLLKEYARGVLCCSKVLTCVSVRRIEIRRLPLRTAQVIFLRTTSTARVRRLRAK
jgi:hypothetical protein